MKFVSFILSLVFLLFAYVPVQAQQGQFTVKQKQALDLNGDGQKEVVELFVRKDQYYERGWKLVVDGKEVADFDSYDEPYLSGEMKFDDLLQDGKPGILLYFHTGSSGGTVRLLVLKMFENQFKPIFDNPVHLPSDRNRFSTKYLGNFEVEFIDKQTGMKGIIPLNPKKRYPDLSLEDADSNLKNMIENFVDPASDYRIENVGKNKPKDIVTEQRVSGMSHADEIARFETRYSFDKREQKYVPVRVSLYSYDANKYVAEKPYY